MPSRPLSRLVIMEVSSFWSWYVRPTGGYWAKREKDWRLEGQLKFIFRDLSVFQDKICENRKENAHHAFPEPNLNPSDLSDKLSKDVQFTAMQKQRNAGILTLEKHFAWQILRLTLQEATPFFLLTARDEWLLFLIPFNYNLGLFGTINIKKSQHFKWYRTTFIEAQAW